MIPNVEIWALPRGEEPVVLADLGDYTLSSVNGEIGTITLSYPHGGAGWELIEQLQRPNRELEIEIRTDGTSVNAKRGILFTAQGDSTKPGAMWELTGLYLGVLMRAARTLYDDSGANGNTDVEGTPGLIVRTLMVKAQSRGTLIDIDFSSFSNSHDSNGEPWEKEAALSFSPGRDYADILSEICNKLGMAEWELTADRKLHLYNPGTRGVDRTEPGAQVTLEYGRDFTDGPVTSSNLESGTYVIGVGVNGMYQEVDNEAAELERGRRIEIYRDYGSVYEDATLIALTEADAALAAAGAHSYSHELVLAQDHFTPGVDYDVGDWVLRAVNGTTEPMRISQLVLSRSNGEVKATVTLGDLIADAEVTTRRMVEGLANGSAIVGTSTLPPDHDDGRNPAAPTGLSLSSFAYYDASAPVASITASWAAVLTNEDGTALDNLSGYEVSYRYEAGQDMLTDWLVAGVTAGTSLTWSDLPQNKIVHVRVRAQNKYNRFGPYSTTDLIQTASDADPPPVPSTPEVSSYLGLLCVAWDGKGSSGQSQPGDYSHTEIHISTTGPLFTVDRPGGTVTDSTTYAGTIVGGPTEFPIAVGNAYGTEFWAKLVSVDKSGNASAASAAHSAVLQQVKDGDVASVSIGKLTAGIMSALMTISGIIRTAATGARVELDSSGLRCYSSTGAMLFEFSIPSSALSIVGKLTAGAGVGAGKTIIIDPTGPRIRIYPDATTKRFEIYGDTTLRPDGTTAAGFNLETRNASGQTDGFAIDAWSTNVKIGHRTTSGSFAPGGYLQLQRIGGGVYLDTGNGWFAGLADGGIGIERGDNFIRINQDNSVLVRSSSNSVTIAGSSINLNASSSGTIDANRPLGTLGAGFSFRAQSGTSQGYRFYHDGSYLRFVQNGTDTYLTDPNGPSGLKCFVIPHPDDPERWLVHACTESPVAGVEYWGEVTLTDGYAEVQLPDYFESLTEIDGRNVQVSMILPDHPLDRVIPGPPPLPPEPPFAWDPETTQVVPERSQIYPVAASRPRHGKFRIVSPAPDGTIVHWHVHAVRSDVPPLVVEPRRDEVIVAGDGPYRYIAGQTEAA